MKIILAHNIFDPAAIAPLWASIRFIRDILLFLSGQLSILILGF